MLTSSSARIPANRFVMSVTSSSTLMPTVSPARASSVGGSGGGVDASDDPRSLRRCALAARRYMPYSTRPSGWRAYRIVPSPKRTSTHFPEIGKSPGIRPGSRRIQPRNAPLRTTGSNSTNASAAWIAPEMVRTPSVTTTTTQKSATNGREVAAVVHVLLLHREQRAAERGDERRDGEGEEARLGRRDPDRLRADLAALQREERLAQRARLQVRHEQRRRGPARSP